MVSGYPTKQHKYELSWLGTKKQVFLIQQSKSFNPL